MGRVSSHSFVFAALLVTASVAVENGDELCCNRLQQNLENQMKRTQLIEDALRRTLAILGSSLGAEFLGSLEEDPVISSIMSVDQSSSVTDENIQVGKGCLLFNLFTLFRTT